MKIGYRIIRIPENFVEWMRIMAIKEDINPDLADLMSQKLLEFSVPEEIPSSTVSWLIARFCIFTPKKPHKFQLNTHISKGKEFNTTSPHVCPGWLILAGAFLSRDGGFVSLVPYGIDRKGYRNASGR